MNREQTKQAIAVMQAYTDGAEIEFREPSGKWHDCEPSWDWQRFDYRVKPTAKFIALIGQSVLGFFDSYEVAHKHWPNATIVRLEVVSS